MAVIAVGTAVVSLTPSKIEGHKNKFRRSSNPVPNKYIVVLDPVAMRGEDGSPNVSANRLSSEFGGQVERVYSNALQGFSVELTEEAARAMSEDPSVMFIEQDSYVSIDATQNNAPWGLDRVDQRNVPLNSAYNYVKTGAGVHVYVIDTGVRTTHLEFGGRATADYDSVYDGQNGQDCHGHGTHVAATIGGATYGVAKDVSIHAVRVLACNGIGTVASAVEGIDWVTGHHASPAVANMSMGSNASPLMDFAVQASIDSGVTYVVAAGNSDSDACTVSPARLPSAITVGASDQSDVKASFSNHGPCVDLFAPGVGITSAWAWSDMASFTANGTSMASPHVAGTVALYLQDNPSATPAQATFAVMGTATSGQMGSMNDGSPNLMVFTAPAGPTAGGATVSGAVLTADGRGMKGIRVVLRNASGGEPMVALTNAFGFYVFSDVEVGELYVMTIQNKRYNFTNTPYTFSLGDDFSAPALVGTPK